MNCSWCLKLIVLCVCICQKLQRQLEFLEVQEEYIKDEQRNLKKEYLHAQEEVKRIQSVPLVIGQFLEAVDQNTGIVGSTTGLYMAMAKHKTAVTPVLMHWSYCSLALSHRYMCSVMEVPLSC